MRQHWVFNKGQEFSHKVCYFNARRQLSLFSSDLLVETTKPLDEASLWQVSANLRNRIGFAALALRKFHEALLICICVQTALFKGGIVYPQIQLYRLF